MVKEKERKQGAAFAYSGNQYEGYEDAGGLWDAELVVFGNDGYNKKTIKGMR